VLEPVAGGDGRRFRLARLPVIAGSVALEVDGVVEEPAPADAEAPPRRWTEVGDLALYGPDDAVYLLDPASGEGQFGDGAPGFRHVRALAYRVGGGSGAVEAGSVTTLLRTVPFVTGVGNPRPASGGADAEDRAATLARGAEEIRSRGRAVALADYDLLARRA